MKQFLSKHGIYKSSAFYASRTTMASLLALYIALAMNLDSPKWAPMTVWIVAQHTRGMSLSKGQYRVAGTCIGAAVALALIAAFAQTPEIFALTLAAWVGACTSLSTATSNFRSYGAVLAGYTAAIISLDSIAQPENVFNIAVARTLDIAIGIAIEGAFAAILSGQLTHFELSKKFDTFSQQSIDLCKSIIRGQTLSCAVIHKHFSAALSLETELKFAALESSELHSRSTNLAMTLTHSLTLLAFTYNLGNFYALESPKTLKVRGLTLLKRWRNHRYLSTLSLREARPMHAGFMLHIDRNEVVHNGLRSFFSMIVAMFIWIHSAGSLGVGFVTIVAVVCSLFATRSNAVAGSLLFFRGGVCAAIASAVCNFCLLPLTSDFEMLALFLFGFLFIAGLLMRHPRIAGGAASFAIFFWDLINPQNSERMSADHFFNGAITLLLGMACATVIFSLVFPASPKRQRHRTHHAACRDLMTLGSHPHKMTQNAWLLKCTGRLGHESALDHKRQDENAEMEFAGMMAVWMIGDAALELRQHSDECPILNQANSAIFDALKTGDPKILADACKTSQALLLHELKGLSDNEKHVIQTNVTLLETVHLAANRHHQFLARLDNKRAFIFQ